MPQVSLGITLHSEHGTVLADLLHQATAAIVIARGHREVAYVFAVRPN